MQHDFPQLLVAVSCRKNVLAQQKQFFPQFIFELRAMQGQGYIQIAQPIVAIENSVALFHVDKLNGEDVGGGLQFLCGHHQRGMMLLASPPFDRARNLRQRHERRIAEHAKQVEIRILRMKFPLRGRTVQNHAHKISACPSAHLLDKFAQQLFFSHAPPLGPAKSSETTKPTQPAKRAAVILSARLPEVLSAERDREQQHDDKDHPRYTKNNEYLSWGAVRIDRSGQTEKHRGKRPETQHRCTMIP